MIKYKLNYSVCAIALALLSACASNPQQYANNAPEQWQLKGKIGIWYGDKRESASIDWSQCGAKQLYIRLSGPLGSGAIELGADKTGATLNHQGESRSAASIDELAAAAQWPIPVEALRFWVRAHAAPQQELRSRINPNGQIEEISQAGWLVNYRYNTAEQLLPNRINAKSADTRITVIVSDWDNQPELCQH